MKSHQEKTNLMDHMLSTCKKRHTKYVTHESVHDHAAFYSVSYFQEACQVCFYFIFKGKTQSKLTLVSTRPCTDLTAWHLVVPLWSVYV